MSELHEEKIQVYICGLIGNDQKIHGLSEILTELDVVNKIGLPFYWEVLPGCTADSTTIIWLLERLKNIFNLKELKEILAKNPSRKSMGFVSR